jgi:hypothetical protein
MLVVVASIGLILAARGLHLPRVESPPIAVAPLAETPSVPAADPPTAVVAVTPPPIPDDPRPTPSDAPPRVVAPETAARLTPQKIRKPLTRSRARPQAAGPEADDGVVVIGCQLALEECGWAAPPPGPQSMYTYEVLVPPRRSRP